MKDEWFISEYQLLAESNCTKLYIKFKLTIYELAISLLFSSTAQIIS